MIRIKATVTMEITKTFDVETHDDAKRALKECLIREGNSKVYIGNSTSTVIPAKPDKTDDAGGMYYVPDIIV